MTARSLEVTSHADLGALLPSLADDSLASDEAVERRLAELAARLVPVAFDLVVRVHDEGPASSRKLLASLPEQDRSALPVVLAAMVPPDRGVTDLLEWVSRPVPPPRPLRPCGTHAAFVRHKKRGEPVDELCRVAESAYQRAHYLRARERRADVGGASV